jgi:hypothetical protein
VKRLLLAALAVTVTALAACHKPAPTREATLAEVKQCIAHSAYTACEDVDMSPLTGMTRRELYEALGFYGTAFPGWPVICEPDSAYRAPINPETDMKAALERAQRRLAKRCTAVHWAP